MGAYGSLWGLMGAYGSLWELMGAYGSLMVAYGSLMGALWVNRAFLCMHNFLAQAKKLAATFLPFASLPPW